MEQRIRKINPRFIYSFRDSTIYLNWLKNKRRSQVEPTVRWLSLLLLAKPPFSVWASHLRSHPTRLTSYSRRYTGQSFLPASEVFDHVLRRAVASANYPLRLPSHFPHDRPEAKTQCKQNVARHPPLPRWPPPPLWSTKSDQCVGSVSLDWLLDRQRPVLSTRLVWPVYSSLANRSESCIVALSQAWAKQKYGFDGRMGEMRHL